MSLSFFCNQVNGFKYFYLTHLILLIINHLFAQLHGAEYSYVSFIIQLNTSHLTELNSQKVLFLTIHFIMSHLFEMCIDVKHSIWPIERTLSGAAVPGQTGPGRNNNEKYSLIPKTQQLEPLHQIVSYHMQDTHYWDITPLQRCSQCILGAQPNRLEYKMSAIL